MRDVHGDQSHPGLDHGDAPRWGAGQLTLPGIRSRLDKIGTIESRSTVIIRRSPGLGRASCSDGGIGGYPPRPGPAQPLRSKDETNRCE